MLPVNSAVPTTIVVAGLALAGYALLMTALNRRMGLGLLAALGVLEILVLVLVGCGLFELLIRRAGTDGAASLLAPLVVALPALSPR